MNYLYFSFITFLIFIVSACMCFGVTKDWLERSGLIFLLADSLLCQYISIGLICFSMLLLIVSGFSLSKAQLTFAGFATFAAVVIQFYYGLQFYQTPEIVVSSKWELWSAYINQKEVIKVQQKFHCCGFFRPNEFMKDRCNVTFPGACFDSIMQGTRNNFTSTGKIFLQQSAVLLISIGFIFIVGRKHRLSTNDQNVLVQSNIIQREDHGTF